MNAVDADAALRALHDAGAQELRHLNGPLGMHLKGTYDLLVTWGNPPYLCLAGLYHAVYGTDGYSERLVPLANRDAIAGIIGASAEELVYLYCAADRLYFYPKLAAEERPTFRDRFTNGLIQLSSGTLDDFCELTFANELELQLRSGEHFTRYAHVFGDLFRSGKFQKRLSSPARQAYSEATSQ